MNKQRIWATVGLVLIVTSIVLMLAAFFVGAAKDLLSNISLFCFLGAAALLLALSYKRKQAAEENKEEE